MHALNLLILKYFGYKQATIQALLRSNYSDADWINIIETDLNAGRPVQYEEWIMSTAVMPGFATVMIPTITFT